MAAGRYDIIVEQGATWSRTMTVADDGAPRDLNGYTIRMQARPRHSSEQVIVALTTGDGITISDPPNGVFELLLTAAQTAALPAISGARYDLELVDGDGVVTRLLEGVFTVSPEVTR